MTHSGGSCKINAVEVGELTVQIIGSPTPLLTVKFAYSNAETGDRFGSGTRNAGWSELTQKRLELLVAAIEQDVAAMVFEEGPTTSRSVEDDYGIATDGGPGL